MRAVPRAAPVSLSKRVAEYGFPSRCKLSKTDEFSSVFSFRRRIFGECLTAHYMPNTLGYPRLGIVVGRKIARRAVARNYIRRIVREWFRKNRSRLGGLDLVVRANRAIGRQDYPRVMEELDGVSGRLRRVAPSLSVT